MASAKKATRIGRRDRLHLERIADDLRARLAGRTLDCKTASDAIGTHIGWVEVSAGLLNPGEYAWSPSERVVAIARPDTEENERFALARALALPALYSTWEGCSQPPYIPEDPALVLAIQDAFAARLLGTEAA